MSTLQFLPIEDIRRRPDARPLDDPALIGLAESIESIGLINPIRVRQVDGGYEVVAGAHRFAACDSLGHREIACFVVDDDDLHAELAMIDENLCRAELSPVDRARQTARRQEIYPAIRQHGGDRRSSLQVEKLKDQPHRFTLETAAATGKSETTVHRDLTRGQQIADDVLAFIQGTPLDTGTYLDKLKRLWISDQMIVAKRDLAELRRREREGVTRAASVRRDLEQPRHGGIAGQYRKTASTAPAAAAPPDSGKLFARFIEIADEIEAMPVAALIDGASRQRAVLGQRASGLADRMASIMEGVHP